MRRYRFFHTPENQIVILRSVKFTSQTAHFFNQTFFYHTKMTDIIIRPQQIQIEIRFKMWLKMFFQICRHFVLI